jgi:hypothetical protein
MEQAKSWSQTLSVHVYAFSPARALSAYEADGNLLLHRLRGSSTFQIGMIAAYLTLRSRFRSRGSRLAALLPLPGEARGIQRWFWHQVSRRTLMRRCASLSIPPLAFVGADAVALQAAQRLGKRYACPAYDWQQEAAVSSLIAEGVPS